MIVLLESFQKFYGNYFFFEMLAMDRCSKNSNSLFYKTPMDASGQIKKKIYNIENLVIVAKWYWCQIIEHKSYDGHM